MTAKKKPNITPKTGKPTSSAVTRKNLPQRTKTKKTLSKSPSKSKTSAKKSKPVKAATKSKAKVKADTKSIKQRKRPAKKPADFQEIFKRFSNLNPEPKGELESVNDFTLLVAVVLSAQATDAGVNKATRALFKKADTPEKMFALGEQQLRDDIKTIGLFRNKAKNVIAISKLLIDEHASKVPQDRDTLETLPGVGRKTANVVMNVAYGEPTMAVDTHVLRVSNRIGLSNGNTPIKVEKDLIAHIPHEYGVPAHHWLILHGRYLCKARKPQCWRCPIIDLCQYDEKIKAP